MKRWLPWFIVSIVSGILVVRTRSWGSVLLQDTDTKVLLNAIRERGNPLSWFWGDWPLANHFYRPISTLFFEFDHAMFGSNAAGYGWTNAILAGLCVLLVFWVAFELTEHAILAGIVAVLFGGFSGGLSLIEWVPGFILLLGGGCFGVVLGGKRGVFGGILGVFFASFYFSTMFWPPHGFDIPFRIIGWLPGRTASVMTVFCLCATGAFARFMRLNSPQTGLKEATAMDLPATKGTVVANNGEISSIWLVLAFLGLLLALGSYEQAVMLPAVLTGILILYLVQGRRVNWWPILGSWLILAGYLAYRKAVIPSGVSGYQAQQFRSGPSVPIDILDFVLPGVRAVRDLVANLDVGAMLFMTSAPWYWIGLVLANAAGIWLAWRDKDRWLILFAQAAALVSYLPMAWLKYFGHYAYWPATFWALYIVLFGRALFRQMAELWSRAPIQAPARG